MSINFCEVCVAVVLCSVITIIFYIASWYNHEENKKEELKEPGVSNIQGLENEQPIPRGEPNETINFDAERYAVTSDAQSSGEIVKEKSDLYSLQDAFQRSRIAENEAGEQPTVDDDYVNVERHQSLSEYDPVVHSDPRTGRLHLSVRYDDERSKLIVQILNAQGLIRPEQLAAPEMCLTFSLTGPSSRENDTEKHTRVVVQNAPVSWKEPLTFCITFANVTKQNLYIIASNKSDPAVIRDREVFIPLNNLGSQGEELNDWFDLQSVQSSH